ncbi:DNA polymerase phi-domain-containing protein [Pisolithus croceorrhizus]|nr:DNA polymerase phi-domain-containing protein [Pisolithus croceorrhizus]
MSTTLPLFWDLSSASKKERVDASVKLISALEQFQINHVPPQEGSDTEDGSRDALDLLNSPDVSYSIRRLVRGLASPRESSRLGFSVALTELLSRINTVTCAQVVSLISDSSKKQGSMTGQEERDILFARLFGLTAVIRSGLLVRQTPLPSSGSSNTQVSSIESYEEILKKLIEIGEAKSWLRESAWWTVGLAIDAVQDSSVPWKAKALGTTVEYLFSKDKESFWSPEKVAMTLKLQPLWPNHDWDSTLAPVFKGPNILSAGNLAPLGRVLKESALDDEEASNPGSGSWNPQIHFVWDMLFDRLLPASDSKQAPQGSFGEFFRVVVDESLFSSTSSAERKYWGFQVFKKALTRVSTDQLPMLFTKNLMRSWINHLSKSDRYLHKISLDVAKHIQSFVQENPALGFPLILQLTGINGSQEFDKLTRTKTVESILTVMDSEGIKNYIFSLLGQVNSKDADEDTAALNSRRTWIADQFAALIRNGSVPKSDEWIQVILDWYVVNGLYSIRKKSGSSSIQALRALPSPPFTEEFQAHCRTRLLSSLADLTSQTTVMKKGDITHKETAVASDGEFWISKVLSTLARLDKDTKHVDPLAPVDEETRALLDRVGKVHEKLSKVSSEKKEVARGFELVLSSLVLQCRCGEEDSVENLESCLSAASRMFASKKSSKKKSQQSALPTDDEPKPIDVLVDLLIGYLENASAYTRSVANEAFSHVTGAAQESTIDLILTQLERRKPAELAEAQEDMMDASSEEEDESSSEASDDDGSLSEESDDEDAQEIRNKIVDLLKTSGMGDDEDESDEESEELMDDEQMMAIDGHLAEIFRSRKDEQRSKKGVDAQREATHFKNRVLDLIDTFVKREPQSPLNIRLILPLIDLVTKSGMDEKQLSDKAQGILKNRLAKSKDVPANGRRDEVETILREIHQRVRKSHSAENLSVLNQSSLYLCRVLVQLNEDGCVARIYQESLDDYISRKASQANLSFFQDFVRRFPALGSKLRDPVLAASSSAVNAYRRCQAFQLLSVILSQLGKVCDDQAITSSFQKDLQKTVLELANGAVDDQSSLSASQLKDLLKVVLVCIRQVQKSDSPPRKAGIWDPAAWNALYVRLAACERFKSSSPLLNMCRQVESVASQLKPPIQNGDGGKRKAEEVVDNTDSKKSDRKKQRKSKS